jgi:hypothetical protein
VNSFKTVVHGETLKNTVNSLNYDAENIYKSFFVSNDDIFSESDSIALYYKGQTSLGLLLFISLGARKCRRVEL